MMEVSDHISRHMLAEFVAGQLVERESEQVVAHLADCDRCLAIVDELWSQQPVATVASTISDLDATTARRLEQRLVRQIHSSNFGGAVADFGTKGFLAVVQALLQPLFAVRRQPTRGGLNND